MGHKIVHVRGSDGELHRFALLEVTEQAAFVCKEEAYDAIAKGHQEPPGIGFPLADVYIGSPDNLRPLEYAQA